MASILEGFLVRLGFDVDQDGMQKFNANVASAAKRVAAIGKAAAATGIAVGAAFVKSASDVDKLYKISNNTGASIKGLQAISRAVANVGGNAENVQAAFVSLSDNIKTYGSSFEQLLKNNLGVSLYDAQGRMRDMADVFVDLRNKLAEMAKTNPGFAKQTAELIGLGGAFDDLMKKGFAEELARQQKASAAWGDSLDRNAQRANNFTTSLSRLWDTITTGAQTASLDFLEVSGLDTWVENLAKTAEVELPALAKTFKKGLQSIFDGSWWDSIKESFSAMSVRGAASEEIEDPEVRKLVEGYAEKSNLRTLPEQIADAHEDSRTETQLAYSNPATVPKWRPGAKMDAPKPQKPLGDSVGEGSPHGVDVDSMAKNVEADVATRYVDSVATRQAVGDVVQSGGTVGEKPQKQGGSSTLTVTQNIVVNGVQDGARFAKDLAKTTNETVNRNVGANAF